MCAIGCYAKAIYALSQDYGKVALFEGVVLFITNSVSGGINLWLSNGGLMTIAVAYEYNEARFIGIALSYFALSEFIPALVYSFTMWSFCK